MSIRRTLRIAIVGLALTGAAVPLYDSFAQDAAGGPAGTATTADDEGTDIGWIGLLGLVGLAGLLGRSRDEARVSRTATAAR